MVMEFGNVATSDDAWFHGMYILMLFSLLVELGYHFVTYTLVLAAGTYWALLKTNV
jgi:hypothetical protein